MKVSQLIIVTPHNLEQVTINYRLGGFGWMGGNNFISQGGTPNVGLHDQARAFDWIQEFIEEFGGDINRQV
jgi:para-nitrobenzyl esterase